MLSINLQYTNTLCGIKLIFYMSSLMSMSLFDFYIEHKIDYCHYLFCFRIRNATEELVSLGSSNSQHKELASGRVERDNNNFLKILTWFRNHNPFTTSEKLVCLDSGFNNEKTQSNVIEQKRLVLVFKSC